jgi:TatA/E family protein of Tat protein translocase
MGPLGTQEMIFIFILALLLFGPKKLPELGRTAAKALAEFRRASNDLKQQFEREMSSIEQETQPLKEIAQSYQSELNSYNYDHSYYDSGAYGSESYDSTSASHTTVGASATQGAESSAAAATPESPAPEGTVAHSAGIESSPATHEVAAAGTHPAVEQQVHGQTPSNS